jgi:hypothetical protein
MAFILRGCFSYHGLQSVSIFEIKHRIIHGLKSVIQFKNQSKNLKTDT